MKIKVTSKAESDARKCFMGGLFLLIAPVILFMLAAGTSNISVIFSTLVEIFSNNVLILGIICLVWLLAAGFLFLQGFGARMANSDNEINEMNFVEKGFFYLKRGTPHKYNYSDIDSASISIQTERFERYSKYGTTEFFCITEFTFYFQCKNDYKESVTFDNSKGDLFKLLSFYNKFPKMNYEVSGPYDDLRKEIELFLKTGKKVLVAEDVVSLMYWFVIILAIVAAYLSNLARGGDIDSFTIFAVLVPAFIFIGIATVLMIMLEIDRNIKNSAKK